MAVACLALFMAMTGTVVAASKIAKNSVGSAQVKNHSLKGGDLVDDTVTGEQVQESSLGVVPRAATAGTASAATQANTAGTARSADRATSAATADRAADSDRLNGKTSSDFASSSQLTTVAAKLGLGQSTTLLERDGLKVVAACSTGTTVGGDPASVLTISAQSASDGATLDSVKNILDGSVGALTLGPGTPDAKRKAIETSGLTAGRVARVVPGFVATSAGGVSIFFGGSSATVVGTGITNQGGSVRAAFGFYNSACAVTAPVLVAGF